MTVVLYLECDLLEEMCTVQSTVNICNVYINVRFQHSVYPIHPSTSAYPFSITGGWSLSQLSQQEKQGTTWAGHQANTGQLATTCCNFYGSPTVKYFTFSIIRLFSKCHSNHVTGFVTWQLVWKSSFCEEFMIERLGKSESHYLTERRKFKMETQTSGSEERGFKLLFFIACCSGK